METRNDSGDLEARRYEYLIASTSTAPPPITTTGKRTVATKCMHGGPIPDEQLAISTTMGLGYQVGKQPFQFWQELPNA